MELKIQRDQRGVETHHGEVFPGASKRQFAYQGESGIGARLVIQASPPWRRGGKLNWDLKHPLYDSYELEISGHSTALNFTLIGYRNDHIQQRRTTGKAILCDKLVTAMSFGELVNKVFGERADVYHEVEAFPPEVVRVMRGSYEPDKYARATRNNFGTSIRDGLDGDGI